MSTVVPNWWCTYGRLHTRKAVKEHGAVTTGHVVQTCLHKQGTNAQRHWVSITCIQYAPANRARKFEAAFIGGNPARYYEANNDSVTPNLRASSASTLGPGQVGLRHLICCGTNTTAAHTVHTKGSSVRNAVQNRSINLIETMHYRTTRNMLTS